MADQKPEGMSWASWSETLIQRAQAEGRFANLAGEGRPLPGLEGPYDELWWARNLLEREQIAFLPAALRIRRDAERTLQALAQIDTETRVRAEIAALNSRIRQVNATAFEGPPTSFATLDIEVVLRRWRAQRDSAVPAGQSGSCDPEARPTSLLEAALILGVAFAFAGAVAAGWVLWG